VKGRSAIKLATVATALLAVLAIGFGPTASVSAHSRSHGCAGAAAAPKSITPRAAQRAVKCLLNKQRAKRGLRKLHSSRDLKKAAHEHSAYMRRHNCFDHQCPGESSIDGRLRHSGYLKSGLHRWLYGENIAYGTAQYASPRSMVKAWMASSEHRANILNPSFRDLGVGIVWGLPGKRHGGGGIYTTDFGFRQR
jgi:uncharacterized protein YkwD